MPTVSVIIPTHNRAAYLKRTLQSVLGQTFTDYEIIVVDDGSTDDTPQTVRGFGDPRIQLVQQTQGERAAARNTGIRQARGEFLAFLDDDDLWLPTRLERALAAFESNQIGVVHSGWRHVDARDQLLSEAPHVSDTRGAVLDALLLGCWFPTSAALIRHTTLEHIGDFDSKRVPVEDWDLWIRAAASGAEFNSAPEPLVLYRLHEDNSTNVLERLEAGSAALLTTSFERLGDKKSALRREAFARLDFHSALKFFGSGQTELAYQRFARAVRAYPSLLDEPATYYQVICAMQPDGYKGTQERLELELGRVYIEQALAAAFAQDASLQSQRARAFGQAYLTLAQLHYGRREMTEARHSMRLAVQANHKLLTQSSVALAASKTLVPMRTLDFLKQRRGSQTQP